MKVEPLRSCIACNEKKTKKELFRIVREEDGSYSLDLSGRKNGRGAYICPKLSCLEKAEKRKAFFRAFKENISEESLAKLREEIREIAE